ncbi:MAG TPA: hypothetical protein VMR51_01960 [Patescibacteria group bacterium]|nr:hypothetical protein [Patescibacteria group bacterium]
MLKKTFLNLIVVTGIILVFSSFAHADIGPKPEMSFNLQYIGTINQSKVSLQQYECDDSQCNKSHPLTIIGPQHFDCENANICTSLAYGYSDYHQLLLKMNGKKYFSNTFKTKGFNSTYIVYISGNGISVDISHIVASTQKTVPISVILKNTLVTVAAELAIIALLVLFKKMPKKLLAAGLLANVISVPLYTYVVERFGFTTIFNLLTAEILIVIFEALIYYLFLKRQHKLVGMLALSFLLNVISFTISYFVTFK